MVRRSRMVGRVVMVGVLACGVGLGAVSASAGALDGKTFVGEMGKLKNSMKGDKDSFVFKDGTFTSTGCVRYGFTPASYSDGMKEQAMTFHSEATSTKEGTMIWDGVVEGNIIKGTARWEKKPGKIKEQYWFRGEAS